MRSKANNRSRRRSIGPAATLALWTVILASCSSNVAETADPTSPAGTEPSESALTTGANVYDEGDTITLITGTDPGGGYDLNVRTIAPFLEDAIREIAGVEVTVVVENVPGAGQQVGYETLARAEPDGRTIALMSTIAAAGQQVTQDAAFDLRELTYLGELGATNFGVLVRKDLDLSERTFNALLERSQDEPLLWGVAGERNLFRIMQSFLEDEGSPLEVNEVGFDGVSDEVASLLRNEIQGTWTTLTSVAEQAEANPELEVLVTSACERVPSLPDIPTMIEQNVPSAEEICRVADRNARGFVGPAGISAEAQALLSAALRQAIENEEHVSDQQASGFEVSYGTPEEQREPLDEMLATFEKYREAIDS